MAMPTLTDSGQRLYDAIGPLVTNDDQYGFAGANLSNALAKMIDPIASIVRDPDADSTAVPGWAVLFDVDHVDGVWLPWVGQWVGVDLTGITDVASQRALVKAPIGYERGTVAAMATRARATLTGSQTVLIYQRTGGNAWKMTATTYVSETPSWQVTRDALVSQVPAGVILTYSVSIGGTYATLAASHGTYSAMEAAHSTYSDIPAHPGA